MQQLNDDMDDLLRKAAEQYPLNTNGADWDKVLQNLNTQPDNSFEEIDKEGGGKRYRKLLWLLLLLPVAWVCFKYGGGTKKAADTEVAANGLKQEVITPADNNVAKKDARQNQSLPKAQEDVAGKQDDKIVVDKSVAKKNTDDKKGILEKTGNKKNGVAATLKQQKRSDAVGDEGSSKETITSKKGAVTKNEDKKVVPFSANTIQPKVLENKNNIVDKNKPLDTSSAQTANSKLNAADSKLKKADDKTAVKQEDKTLATANKAVDNKVNKTIAKQDDKAAQKPLTNVRQKQFYIGLLGGADLSTVKLASLSAGYSVGGILGYRINNHWGVETGFFWDKKSYYANGKDFNTSKLTMLPQHTYVVNVDGYCNMYEIPVNVNYYFGKESGYNWFVNAGASSYLMKKESYDYLLERYNVQWPGSWSYKNSSKDWFSILNIGAGFDHQIGKSGKLRLQPYFKIPLGGAGKGSLPITSTGFYIGYTQKLF